MVLGVLLFLAAMALLFTHRLQRAFEEEGAAVLEGFSDIERPSAWGQ